MVHCVAIIHDAFHFPTIVLVINVCKVTKRLQAKTIPVISSAICCLDWHATELYLHGHLSTFICRSWCLPARIVHLHYLCQLQRVPDCGVERLVQHHAKQQRLLICQACIFLAACISLTDLSVTELL